MTKNRMRFFIAFFCIFLIAPGLNAQTEGEEEKKYDNFTLGERFGAAGMNIVPGLGSMVLQKDYWGGGIHIGSVALSASVLITGWQLGQNGKTEETITMGKTLFGYGVGALAISYLFGLIRPFFAYKVPVIGDKNEGLQVTCLTAGNDSVTISYIYKLKP